MNPSVYSLKVVGLKDFLGSSAVKNLPAIQVMQETWVRPLGQEDPQRRAWQPTPIYLLEKIPWKEEPGGLWSMKSQRVRLNMYSCCLKKYKEEKKKKYKEEKKKV